MPKFKPIVVIPDSELLTAPECAALLRVQLSTVRAWILHKKLPVVRLGKRCVRFRRCDLDALIEQSVVPAETGANRFFRLGAAAHSMTETETSAHYLASHPGGSKERAARASHNES